RRVDPPRRPGEGREEGGREREVRLREQVLEERHRGQDDGRRKRLPRPAAPEEGRRDVRQAVRPGQGGNELGRDPGVLGPRRSGVKGVREIGKV
ncbi:hypothetical protein THAOC_17617, partial [Thalassiosira oceanica]